MRPTAGAGPGNVTMNVAKDLLGKALVAAENCNWRHASLILREIPCPIALEEVLGANQGVPLAEACWRGGYVFAHEVLPVVAPPSGSAWEPDRALFPQALSDELFRGCARAFRGHIEDADWNRSLESFGHLLELPGANGGREAMVRDSYITAMIHLESEQTRATEFFKLFRPARDWGAADLQRHGFNPAAFELPGRLLMLAAQAQPWPCLAQALLLETLKTADWPILAHMGPECSVALAAEIMALRADTAACMELGRPGREWFDRAAGSGAAQQGGPGESLQSE
jgi:hypothetical protein